MNVIYETPSRKFTVVKSGRAYSVIENSSSGIVILKTVLAPNKSGAKEKVSDTVIDYANRMEELCYG